jgi:vacuolar protein sorting-associated protein 16
MAEHPTTSWQAMQDGNVFYRQQRLYTLDGKLPNLGDCIVAGCHNGGPLGECALPCILRVQRFTAHPTALMRDTSKLIAIGPSTPMFAKSQIHVYSPSGEGLLLLGVRFACFANSYALFDPPFLVGASKDHSLWMDWR